MAYFVTAHLTILVISLHCLHGEDLQRSLESELEVTVLDIYSIVLPYAQLCHVHGDAVPEENTIRICLDRPIMVPELAFVHHLVPHVNENVGVAYRFPISSRCSSALKDGVFIAREDADFPFGCCLNQRILLDSRVGRFDDEAEQLSAQFWAIRRSPFLVPTTELANDGVVPPLHWLEFAACKISVLLEALHICIIAALQANAIVS